MDEMKLLMFRLAVIRRIADIAQDPGKTSIQKIVYFLQSEARIPLEYRFKMHYFGPYSEKLDGNLSLANAMGIVEVRPDPDGYGYHVTGGQFDIDDIEPPRLWEEIDHTIAALGDLELPQLELLATVHFVRSLRPQLTKIKVINTVHRLKPKFPKRTIEEAYADIFVKGLIKSGFAENTA